MKTRKILFPSDFSTKGNEALEYAATLAQETGAKLLIAHIQEPPPIYGEGTFYYGVPEPNEAALKTMLDKVVPRQTGIVCERRLLQGNPAIEIVDLAKRENVDLIVMGSHGRTGIARLLMGSVAEAVMREAECPVTIVKSKAQAPHPTPAGSAP